MKKYQQIPDEEKFPVDQGYRSNTSKKKKIGRVSSLTVNEDFGFIRFDEGEELFFHINNASERLQVDDSVVFSVRSSKRYPDKLEACRVHKLYRQPAGPGLILSDNLYFMPGVKEKLLELINEIEICSDGSEPPRETVLEYRLENGEGKAFACETTIGDDIFYAKRKNRRGYSRFVKNKQPETSALFTIIIRFRDGFHQVVASYFGPKTPPEPWDKIATPEALDFWRNHALIPDDGFNIDYSTVKDFDPDFFKSFEEIQGTNTTEDNEVDSSS
jgi:cold shock CspA family protein